MYIRSVLYMYFFYTCLSSKMVYCHNIQGDGSRTGCIVSHLGRPIWDIRFGMSWMVDGASQMGGSILDILFGT